MSRFVSSRVFLAAVMSMGLMACGGEDEPTAKAETVEFLTFWGKDSEFEAVQAIVDIHKTRRPNADQAGTEPALGRALRLPLQVVADPTDQRHSADVRGGWISRGSGC